jgi:hypothetical protein
MSSTVFLPPPRIVLGAICVAALLPLSLAAYGAYKEGPMPNMTGGFGDSTCRLCHMDNPLNAPRGKLSISGVPVAFTPGQKYDIGVLLQRKGMHRGGFEISARFPSGQQAGTWRTLDNSVQIQRSQDDALEFPQHTSSGSTAAVEGTISWKVEWTAPATAASPVQFNLAANASNDDASPLGDYIYVLEKHSLPKRR